MLLKSPPTPVANCREKDTIPQLVFLAARESLEIAIMSDVETIRRIIRQNLQIDSLLGVKSVPMSPADLATARAVATTVRSRPSSAATSPSAAAAVDDGSKEGRLRAMRENEVRDCCKKVIDGVAGDGGYIMDASAIIQNDAKVENIKAMTDFTREYGVY